MTDPIEVVREALLFAAQRIPQDAECKRGESCDVCPVLDAATQALDSIQAELAQVRHDWRVEKAAHERTAAAEAQVRDELAKVRHAQETLAFELAQVREALGDIVNASRDEGLAAMCNWMRNRAAAALTEETDDRYLTTRWSHEGEVLPP